MVHGATLGKRVSCLFSLVQTYSFYIDCETSFQLILIKLDVCFLEIFKTSTLAVCMEKSSQRQKPLITGLKPWTFGTRRTTSAPLSSTCLFHVARKSTLRTLRKVSILISLSMPRTLTKTICVWK